MFFGERPETGTAARSRSRIPQFRQGAGIPLKRRPNEKGTRTIYARQPRPTSVRSRSECEKHGYGVGDAMRTVTPRLVGHGTQRG